MKQRILFFLAAAALASCGKDKFKTVPQVKINSFGPAVVQKAQLITLKATVTDQEGDLQDSVLIVRKRYNGTLFLTVDTLRVGLKTLNVPNEREIEFQYTIPYGEQTPGYNQFQGQENTRDTNLSYGLIVRDNAGNRSDYVESDKILLKKI